MDLPRPKKKNAKALIVEGGGMRGAFSGGVMAAMCKLYPAENFDIIVGVSAGSCALAYYVTEEDKGSYSLHRILNIWKNELHGSRFISFRNLLRGKEILRQDYLIDHLFFNKHKIHSEKLDKKGSVPFYVVVSSLAGQVPHYIKATGSNLFSLLRAATALPIATKGRQIFEGNPYTDGGALDPIPVKAVIDAGYDEILLILNYTRKFLSEPVGKVTSRIAFPNHKSFAKLLSRIHHERYNDAKKIILNPPKGVKINIIDPAEELSVSLVTTKKKLILEAVNHGWERAHSFFTNEK